MAKTKVKENPDLVKDTVTQAVINTNTSTAGSYVVTYTDTDADTATATVVILNLDNAAFAYSASSFEPTDADPTPTITGLTGGTFSGTTINGTTITGTSFKGGSFSGTTINGTTITGTSFAGGSFSGTSLLLSAKGRSAVTVDGDPDNTMVTKKWVLDKIPTVTVQPWTKSGATVKPTTANDSVMPNGTNGTIGSSGTKWKAVYANDVYTGDLHLKNDKGDWTMIEAEEYLTIRNNKTGKTFKLMMEEV